MCLKIQGETYLGAAYVTNICGNSNYLIFYGKVNFSKTGAGKSIELFINNLDDIYFCILAEFDDIVLCYYMSANHQNKGLLGCKQLNPSGKDNLEFKCDMQCYLSLKHYMFDRNKFNIFCK